MDITALTHLMRACGDHRLAAAVPLAAGLTLLTALWAGRRHPARASDDDGCAALDGDAAAGTDTQTHVMACVLDCARCYA